jgi:asparagine N-glycosylation enzyme membrane subunit Stt3
MTQHSRASLVEAATQAAVGVGYAVVFGVECLHLPTAWSAAVITVSMFLLSTLRGYVIRRRFDREREP